MGGTCVASSFLFEWRHGLLHVQRAIDLDSTHQSFFILRILFLGAWVNNRRDSWLLIRSITRDCSIWNRLLQLWSKIQTTKAILCTMMVLARWPPLFSTTAAIVPLTIHWLCSINLYRSFFILDLGILFLRCVNSPLWSWIETSSMIGI